ncbi:DUF933 domain-containing protein [Candidatus Saccharibacteria bacterium]|nr:DUF933 domain-containing protein [Candidatus Saccharibacteria bacterium]
MIRAGIVGLPNAGKTTTFNSLTGAEAMTAPYPFSTIDPNRSMLKIHDPDFVSLAEAIVASDMQYSEVELIDIAGLIKGASEGEGLGNEFLGQMKECHVLLHVVRVTEDNTIDDLHDDLRVIDNEVALFDHKLLNKPFEKARRLVKLFPKDKGAVYFDKIVSAAFYGTRDGTPIISVVEKNDLPILDEYGLISLKEKVVIANTDGTESAADLSKDLPADITINSLEVGELSELSRDDQIELGYTGDEVKVALFGLCRAILRAASMKQFYTVGHLGVGQWIIDNEADAVSCANLIHDTLGSEIKSVKVAQIEDFKIHKSWANLAKNGLVKTYGAAKYIPKDKEVVLFE